ncbi:hypothetical protein KR51_00016610 [Rubidibacter lacunae KORDI 51-2]|uniref:Isopropylmalate/homocitrate/citramalate synthase n=1 Tax=Rubidibacter lacunae KORDI 51-2 TaxID=582515 RepID=U5DB90_9CHRO|nr:hypothetical protein [Rubidibacter lacunae]ERN41808.1 hypothetical protein KR51_00016610 [Rubidibacter lacunae KORDI 51-2]
MTNPNGSGSNKDKFLYPRHRYYGEVKPEYIVFNANLQEFAQRVSYTCNLETGGKIAPEVAFRQIKSCWNQLKRSYKGLGIEDEPPNDEDGSKGA